MKRRVRIRYEKEAADEVLSMYALLKRLEIMMWCLAVLETMILCGILILIFFK